MALAAKSFSDLITFTRASTAGYYGSDGLYKTAASGVARTGTYADYKPADITQQNILTYSSGFDNAAWTKSNGFVQTNLLNYSQDFSNAYWGKSNCTISASAQTAPDGTATASLITANTTAFTYLNISSYVAAATAAINTFVISVMAGTVNSLSLGLYDGTTFGSGSAVIISGPGTLTQQTGSRFLLSGLSTSQWTRVAITRTTVSAGTGLSPFMYPRDQSSSNAGDTLHIWGAQLVQGSVAGDYRATTSAALPILYADPLGTTLAMKVCEDTATSQHSLNQYPVVAAGSVTTMSVYLKAGERNLVRIINYDMSSNYYGVYFDLATGTVTGLATGGAYTDGAYSVVNAGSGWWRVSVTAGFAGTARQLSIAPATSGTTIFYAGNGSSGYYVFGAQACIGATALPYLATTATGAHVTTTGSKRGFLVEESRTNLLLRSNDWSASWGLLNVTQTPAQAIGPDGTVSMTKLAVTTTAATLSNQAFVATSTTMVYSIYVKQGSGATEANEFAWYNNTTSTTLAMLSINYATGVITQTTGTGATAEPIGNGIWRLSIPVSSGITVGNSVQVYPCFVGGIKTAGIFAYVYGAQVEVGSFATSYIPTTTAQVTRAADVASVNTLSPWYNSVAGTLYTEFQTAPSASAPQYFAELDDGTANNAIYNARDNSGNGISQIMTGGASQAALTLSTLANVTVGKIAVAYAANDFAASKNGGAAVTDATGTVPTGLNILRLGANVYGGLNANFVNGHLRRITYYPRRLTNAELQTLTTL